MNLAQQWTFDPITVEIEPSEWRLKMSISVSIF